jgi:hypothetical protein
MFPEFYILVSPKNYGVKSLKTGTDRGQKDVSKTDVKGKVNEQNPLALDIPPLSD